MSEASERALDAPELEALEALIRILDLGSLVGPPEVLGVAPAHVAGLAGAPVAAGLATLAGRLGYALAGVLAGAGDEAGEALNRERADAVRLLGRATELVDALESETPDSGGSGGSGGSDDDLLASAVSAFVREGIDSIARRPVTNGHPRWADAVAVLREGGAEHGHEVALAWDRQERRPVAVRAGLHPAEGALVLTEYALQYAEAWVAADSVLALERRASAWFFSRWSSPRGTAAATRERREQEWALLDRASLALGDSMVEGFIQSGSTVGLAAGVRAALRGLAHSRMGVFEVVERPTPHRCDLLDALTGDRYHVYEHNDELRYRPGSSCMGRLFPLFERNDDATPPDGADMWIRSPGTAFFESDVVHGLDLAETLKKARLRGVEPAMLAEGLLSKLGPGRAKVPREMPAAANRKEAQALWEQANDELLRAGLAEDMSSDDVTAGDVPAGLREAVEAAGSPRRLRGYHLDEVMGDWIVALGEQMHGRVGASARPGRRRAKAKGKKPRR